MKKKIRAIMYECFPFDPDHFTCFVDATRIDIAINKIAKLFEYKDTTDWAGIDPVKWGVPADCDCKGCHPELWELDDGNIWRKKPE